MSYALCSFDADHREHHNKLAAYERIQEKRDVWAADRKFQLMSCADNRHALMLNLLERMNEEETADLLLALIQPEKEPRFKIVEQTRSRLFIEAGKVAESEAKVMQDRGFFGRA